MGWLTLFGGGSGNWLPVDAYHLRQSARDLSGPRDRTRGVILELVLGLAATLLLLLAALVGALAG